MSEMSNRTLCLNCHSGASNKGDDSYSTCRFRSYFKYSTLTYDVKTLTYIYDFFFVDVPKKKKKE